MMMMHKRILYQFHILDQLLVPNVAYYPSSLLDREMKRCIQKASMGMLGAKQSKRMR